MASAPANSGEWRSVTTSAVDRESGGGAQDRADVVRIGDLIERQHEAVRGQFGYVDRLQRPRLEQQPLMHRVARQALGDLLGRDDLRLDAARGDLGRKRSAAALVA